MQCGVNPHPRPQVVFARLYTVPINIIVTESPDAQKSVGNCLALFFDMLMLFWRRVEVFVK